ncbi:Hsp20/alpha crystallin family protein [Acaryochloris marina]|uniref:Hsp20/alpha crystallin family protein n=1 Tax=Acaryochloris marina TaxID=155978 RepID=UPI001BAFD672|nr:Hsp20/alpha crystallin family protein [Acaryochloris marina]QUY45490.1 Hsp20/alpha crystallin family protein [Acaryochloris marina S15]
MMIRYWNPIEEVDSVHRQIDNLFEGILDTDESQTYASWTPTIDLWDRGDALILKTFLPGVKAENLDIQATHESISIFGVRHPEELKEETKRLFSDISYGCFRRASKLPVAIQNTKVEASFDQGILILTLPKVEREQNKVVKVNFLSENNNSETSQTALEASHTSEAS